MLICAELYGNTHQHDETVNLKRKIENDWTLLIVLTVNDCYKTEQQHRISLIDDKQIVFIKTGRVTGISNNETGAIKVHSFLVAPVL